ncbi:hypothetical protein [Streptomyces sp. NPDC056190]|uniref:hypothetical protein n=1 Tax=Streptomyces sp. NPDC056190 TaxID=3345741 RepID=UPI0035DE7699
MRASRGLWSCPADQHHDAHAAENIDAAACAHHDGDSEESCRRTVAALTGLPGDYRTGLVHRRAQDLHEAIPAQYHRERAVRDLRNVLAA